MNIDACKKWPLGEWEETKLHSSSGKAFGKITVNSSSNEL